VAGPLVSSFPELLLDIAFASDPGDSSPKWFDISEFLVAAHIKRGRGLELERNQAGVMTVRLNTSDRRFEPTYAGVLVNRALNPSVETNSTGWTITGGGNTLTRVDRDTISSGWDPSVELGIKVLKANSSLGNPYAPTYSLSQSTDNGAHWIASVYVFVEPGSPAIGQTLSLYLREHGLGGDSDTKHDYVLAAGEQRLEVDRTLTRTDLISLQVIAERASPSPDETFYLDGLQIERASGSTPAEYTDGSLDNCRWEGTEHGSRSYRGGPHYPNVVPFRRIRLRARWASVTYPLFQGYIERWPPVDRPGRNTAYVDVECVDAFAVLAEAPVGLPDAYEQDTSDAHIDAYLDTAGWPAADRNVLPGQTTIQARTIPDGQCLSEMHTVNETELGNLFVSADGLVTFQGRHYRLLNYTTPAATFEDEITAADALLPYRSADLADEGNSLKNRIVVNRVGGSQQVFEDSASVARYLKHELARDTLHISETESGDYGRYLLQRYKDPDYRGSKVVLRPRMDDDLWQYALGLELGERITLKQHPPPVDSGAIIKDVHIDGIEHEVSRTAWETTWLTTPADPYVYWILDSTTYSVLDSTTRVAY
jgi:hypothetical protein